MLIAASKLGFRDRVSLSSSVQDKGALLNELEPAHQFAHRCFGNPSRNLIAAPTDLAQKAGRLPAVLAPPELSQVCSDQEDAVSDHPQT